MPDVEVVANIQDLVFNLESVIAVHIMADINRTNRFQKTAVGTFISSSECHNCPIF
ncbi:hypothetical protein NIES3275_21640 [Microchaete diplosiphon NIES-3275]|nr:hypothetical protein NIES3275_21640 [Microchaete diplosiphon NIES-3275]